MLDHCQMALLLARPWRRRAAAGVRGQQWPACRVAALAAVVGGGWPIGDRKVVLAADAGDGRLFVLAWEGLLTPGAGAGRRQRWWVGCGWRRRQHKAGAGWRGGAVCRQRWRRAAAGVGVGLAVATDSSASRLLVSAGGTGLGPRVGSRRVLFDGEVVCAAGVGVCGLPALAEGWRLPAAGTAGGCWGGLGGAARHRLCCWVAASVCGGAALAAGFDGERLLALAQGCC